MGYLTEAQIETTIKASMEAMRLKAVANLCPGCPACEMQVKIMEECWPTLYRWLLRECVIGPDDKPACEANDLVEAAALLMATLIHNMSFFLRETGAQHGDSAFMMLSSVAGRLNELATVEPTLIDTNSGEAKVPHQNPGHA